MPMNLTKEELIKGAHSLWREILGRDDPGDGLFGIVPPDAFGGWRVLNSKSEECSGLPEAEVVMRAEVLKVFAKEDTK
jgi:hypothetical protein